MIHNLNFCWEVSGCKTSSSLSPVGWTRNEMGNCTIVLDFSVLLNMVDRGFCHESLRYLMQLHQHTDQQSSVSLQLILAMNVSCLCS